MVLKVRNFEFNEAQNLISDHVPPQSDLDLDFTEGIEQESDLREAEERDSIKEESQSDDNEERDSIKEEEEEEESKSDDNTKSKTENERILSRSLTTPHLISVAKKDDGTFTVIFQLYIHCEDCSRNIKKAMKKHEGVEAVSIDLRNNKVKVIGKVDPVRVKEFLERKAFDIVFTPQPKKDTGLNKRPAETEAASNSPPPQPPQAAPVPSSLAQTRPSLQKHRPAKTEAASYSPPPQPPQVTPIPSLSAQTHPSLQKQRPAETEAFSYSPLPQPPQVAPVLSSLAQTRPSLQIQSPAETEAASYSPLPQPPQAAPVSSLLAQTRPSLQKQRPAEIKAAAPVPSSLAQTRPSLQKQRPAETGVASYSPPPQPPQAAPVPSSLAQTRPSLQKKDILGWIFVITNFVLEIPSVVFDQMSSGRKPQYALLSMLMSFAALIICIVELIYRCHAEKVSWKWRATLPWFYYPSRYRPFGNFKDIVGLICALFQCIFASVNYGFARHHADSPFKASFWPIVFSFGLLCSKFLAN